MQTSKLYVKTNRGGVWSGPVKLRDLPDNWWGAFDVVISDSGTVYVGYSDFDYPMAVYRNTPEAPTLWPTINVVTQGFSIGSMKLAASSDGSTITFASTAENEESDITLSTYSYDEGDEFNLANIETDVVHEFANNNGDFNNCTIRSAVYTTCDVGVAAPQLVTATDGSQLLLVQAHRNPANGGMPGSQFKIFKAHRDSAFDPWTFDGAILTQSMGSKDDTYAFFMYPLAFNGDGQYAVAITTGKTTLSYNTVKVFTGDDFASAPIQQDSTYLEGLHGTTDPAVVEKDGTFFLAFQRNYKSDHYFGTIGSLSTTTRKLTQVTDAQDVKNMVVFNNKITAVVSKPNTATYTTTFDGTSWTALTKVLSYSKTFSPTGLPVAVSDTQLIIAAPKYVKIKGVTKQSALYANVINAG